MNFVRRRFHGCTQVSDAERPVAADQAALGEGGREKLFRAIAKALEGHQRKYHLPEPHEFGFSSVIELAAPGGGGWRLEEGKKIKRYEGDPPKEQP